MLIIEQDKLPCESEVFMLVCLDNRTSNLKRFD